MQNIKELFNNVKSSTEKLQQLLDYENRGLITREELERLVDQQQLEDSVPIKSMVERGFLKHAKFWGQEESEEHSAAVAGNKVCYFCLAELEEKYGIDQAIKTGYIPYN